MNDELYKYEVSVLYYFEVGLLAVVFVSKQCKQNEITQCGRNSCNSSCGQIILQADHFSNGSDDKYLDNQ